MKLCQSGLIKLNSGFFRLDGNNGQTKPGTSITLWCILSTFCRSPIVTAVCEWDSRCGLPVGYHPFLPV